ncbi:hypothetical protein ACEWY4_022821 [Coilia grayii]|uniref:C1q domain-containing protein n=1 Tax=Coilia grayii TaxID=363190 RepID=A0ABD1J186_9TELE
MRAAITLLVLLFSMCGAQTRSTQTEVQTESQSTGAAADDDDAAAAEVSTQLDIYAELRALRDMVEEQGDMLVEQQTTLRSTQDELKKMEAENAAVKERLVASETKVGALERGLVASETKVGALETVNDAQEAELKAMATRLAVSETEVANLRKENTAQQTQLTNIKTEVMNLINANAAQDSRISASEAEVENLKIVQEAELTAVKTRLAVTEMEVQNLEKKITETPKVAFSAGLTNSGYIQSGNTELNLVFTKVITNVGQAYSSTTGFFTAPVRGVYYFRFTVMDYPSSAYAHIKIFRNVKQVMLLADYESQGHLYLSGGVALQLEVGDVVNLRLPAGCRLLDDSNNHSTFSGFLLFPL